MPLRARQIARTVTNVHSTERGFHEHEITCIYINQTHLSSTAMLLKAVSYF